MDMKFNLTVTTSDIIAALGVIIGVWIAWVLQRKLSTVQAIKSFHIEELKNIKDFYANFIGEIIANQRSASEIKDWFKIMSSRISSFEGSICGYYNIHSENIGLISVHSTIQIFITGTDEFNDCYKKKAVTFTTQSKDELFKRHNEIIQKMMDLSIKINSSGKRWKWFWQKKN